MLTPHAQAKAINENGDGVVTFPEYKKALGYLTEK